MTENIPIGPFFIAPLKTESSGVDFLGLRQVNLDMMDTCLPGINNFTRYVRCYSVIAWIYWKFYLIAEGMGIDQPSASQLENFKDKTELLFTWGHHGLSLSGIPGISTLPPATDEPVSLLFSAWKRSVDNTSLMAAPTYGPSAKNTGGLGFIAPVSGVFYKVCGNGIRLAEALDELLSKQKNYALLKQIEPASGDENDAKELFPAWNVKTPSPAEQKAFEHSFYDPKKIGTKTKIGQRSATVNLILQLLENADNSLTASELRVAMAYGKLKHKEPLPLPYHIELARLRWLTLQIRQAQRLAMESLFSWTEWRIMSFSEQITDEIVTSALDTIKGSREIFPFADTTNQIRSSMFGDLNNLSDLIAMAKENRMYCIFELTQLLLEQLGSQGKLVVSYAMRILFLCCNYVEVLKQNDDIKPLLAHGRAERISLLHWHNMLVKWGDRSFDEFFRYILENLILSQHFGVAASRFDGNGQRLRIAIEEEGLVPMVPSPLKPFIGEDRLSMALYLMADCGLISSFDKGEKFHISAPSSRLCTKSHP